MSAGPDYVATVGVYEKFGGWIVRLRIDIPGESAQYSQEWCYSRRGANWKAKRVRRRFRRAGWNVE
jgi:hypothetical protein